MSKKLKIRKMVQKKKLFQTFKFSREGRAFISTWFTRQLPLYSLCSYLPMRLGLGANKVVIHCRKSTSHLLKTLTSVIYELVLHRIKKEPMFYGKIIRILGKKTKRLQ